MSNANPRLPWFSNDKGELIFLISGYADTRPIAENTSEAGRRENRQIDIRFSMAPPTEEDMSIVNFYCGNAPLSAQMKILTELDADYVAYQNIFPAVADALIQTVDRARADKKTCLEIFYHRLGDPRIGNTWVVLGSDAKRIAYHRLKERREHGKLLGNIDKDKSVFYFK